MPSINELAGKVDKYANKAEKKVDEIKADLQEAEEKAADYLNKVEETISIFRRFWDWILSIKNMFKR